MDLDDIDPLFFEQPYYLAPDAAAPEALQAARRGDGRAAQGGDRPGRDALEGEPRGDPPARRRAVPRDDALRRRGAAPGGPAPRRRRAGRAVREGDGDGPPAHRGARPDISSPTGTTTSTGSSSWSSSTARPPGEEIVAEPAVEEPGKVVDLMAALEASLARAGAPAADDEAAEARGEARSGRRGPGSPPSSGGAPGRPPPAAWSSTGQPHASQTRAVLVGRAGAGLPAHRAPPARRLRIEGGAVHAILPANHTSVILGAAGPGDPRRRPRGCDGRSRVSR